MMCDDELHLRGTCGISGVNHCKVVLVRVLYV